LLRLCREMVVRLGKTESALVRSLERDSLLVERVERLMTIPAVGPITALTWALEVGDVQRFSSIKKAISYCGLCGAERSSANITQRTPLSKQRNKHLQTVLIEAAKVAPRNSPELAMVYDQEKQKGNANRATLAVARKMVAYLVAVDRRLSGSRKQKPHRCVAGVNTGGFLQRAACQVSSVADWATERKLRRPPSNCFETGRRSQTQSSVQAVLRTNTLQRGFCRKARLLTIPR
jgi:hypothetical protein